MSASGGVFAGMVASSSGTGFQPILDWLLVVALVDVVAAEGGREVCAEELTPPLRCTARPRASGVVSAMPGSFPVMSGPSSLVWSFSSSVLGSLFSVSGFFSVARGLVALAFTSAAFFWAAALLSLTFFAIMLLGCPFSCAGDRGLMSMLALVNVNWSYRKEDESLRVRGQ